MLAQTGYFDTLKSVAGKVFTYLASITLTGTDGKTITCTQNTSLDEAVAMSSKAPKTDTIKGDGTAGRVLRVFYLLINNGTNAATIKPSTVNRWQGDVNAAEDNLGKGGDTGVFALNAGGDTLTLQDAGISGNAVAVISSRIGINVSGTALTVSYYVAGGIVLEFFNAATGAAADLTTLVDTGLIYVDIAYITSA